VKNKYFIDAFKVKFVDIYVTNTTPDDLRCLELYNNPFRLLIEISNNNKQNNQIVIDLIELILKKLPVSENDIFESTFKHPTRSSFIYYVLFNDCFRKLATYDKFIELMDTLWTTWNEKGLHAEYIKTWKEQKAEQRKVANQMWNAIQRIKNRERPFEVMVEQDNNEFVNKEKISKKTRLCLQEYCQTASDIGILLNEIQSIEKKLWKDIVRSVEIPESIASIQSYVDQLIPYTKSQLWENFLKQNKNKFISKFSIFEDFSIE